MTGKSTMRPGTPACLVNLSGVGASTDTVVQLVDVFQRFGSSKHSKSRWLIHREAVLSTLTAEHSMSQAEELHGTKGKLESYLRSISASNAVSNLADETCVG